MRPQQALAPVRAYLEQGAQAEAEHVRAAARAEAEEIVRRARLAAERAVTEGALLGELDAAPLAAAQRRRGRAAAQALVLGARRQAYDELRRRVLAEADGLRGDPGYGPLLRRLTALATRTAGAGAIVSYPAAGGVVARSGQAVVDCSLPRLAGQAVAALGDQVRELWES